MNVRLKLKVSKTSKIKIENSGLLIYVENNSAQIIDELAPPGTTPANLGGRDGARIRDLSALHIICDKDKADKFYYLTLLKNKLKNSVADETDG